MGTLKEQSPIQRQYSHQRVICKVAELVHQSIDGTIIKNKTIYGNFKRTIPNTTPIQPKLEYNLSYTNYVNLYIPLLLQPQFHQAICQLF